MQLISERLVLRPVSVQDRDMLMRIYGDPATNTFNPAGPLANLDEAQQLLARWIMHWQQHGFGNMALTLRYAPYETIGFGGFSLREFGGKPVNNLGYRLATHAWGQGLATEFTRTMVRYGFEEYGLEVIDAAVRPDHLASQRVLEKAGFAVNGHVYDVPDAPASLTFQITLAQWRAAQGTPK
ncbi:GNAT family N-acetyltransferase [Pantoea piersonii]|uniref:GNAT family N-acetyltransferase n=1 Tax=Pantoea piersonii TaxID=2364647 RepID=UPI0028A75500|nr:GNAT family N-acetyltransferase [Pantoea piersonii]